MFSWRCNYFTLLWQFLSQFPGARPLSDGAGAIHIWSWKHIVLFFPTCCTPWRRDGSLPSSPAIFYFWKRTIGWRETICPTLKLGQQFTSMFFYNWFPFKSLSSFHVGHDDHSGMCSSRRRTQPCDSQIYPPLQHAVPAHSLRAQPQADLQSKDTRSPKNSVKTCNGNPFPSRLSIIVLMLQLSLCRISQFHATLQVFFLISHFST